MDLVILADGTIRAVYAEEIDLAVLGQPVITRASHVDPDASGCWIADLTPVFGPLLGPFAQRSQALAAEQAWLEANWLVRSARSLRTRP